MRPASRRPRETRLSIEQVFLERVPAGAEHAEAVERRDAGGAGEVAVGAAAGAAVRQRDADLLGERFGLGMQIARVRASGSHTGRVTVRVTSKRTSFSWPASASMRSTPRSRSAWRLAMLSTCAVQVVATQLTHSPPRMTPTLKVQSSVVMSSISADAAWPWRGWRSGLRR